MAAIAIKRSGVGTAAGASQLFNSEAWCIRGNSSN